ncbi:MAG: restriction endonuclease subunit S [Methanosarcina sp.]|uniref:restriction endonuclease subunit S n=1 Tax=Methanosarcina sp. TaxID=2213 RepID=UPI002628CB1E|nr:restriction endonuclease subunit S [Methanosarcina sp.]MDD3245510.1 restriction endonuclease subunit S [Methanosarcina sp.]MDD4248187.1 restriction endonuclease subunit S [Methanosarcina sp.]
MKNNSWPEVSFGSYIDLLTGFPFKSAKYVDDPNEIRLLRGDNIVQGTLRWNNCKRWNSSEIKQFSKYSLELNDVVLAMDRPWIEAGLKWAYINESDLPCLLVQRVSRLRGKNGLLTNFIRYIISDINFTNYVKSVITGINIPHISGPQIQAYQFRLPPVETQQKIASILSSYDDLLENNTRRIEILEQMAKLVYEEWFVKFKFPGHENVKIIDDVPEGWEKISLGEVLTLQRGFDLPVKMRKDGTYPIYASTGINGYHDVAKVKGPGVVTGRSGSLGTVLYVPEDFWPLNTTLWVKEFKNVGPIYSVHLLSSLQLEQYNGGVAVPTLNRNDVHRIEVLRPPEPILKLFEKYVTPMCQQIEILKKQRGKLEKTRDLLLPKLISGEIDVSDLDIHIRNEFQES